MEPHEIIESFKYFDYKYKREEIDAALAQREEITPLLISVLEEVLINPERYIDDDDYFGHIYAFMLLGHFKETKAHDVIVDLFSLPWDLPDDLFGDSITEDLPIVLLRTCNQKTDRIKELILNKDANEYSRGSAIEALKFAVIEGFVTREEVLSFYKELFSEDQADPSTDFFVVLASCVNDLYPEELMDTIEAAYESGLISPGFIGYDDFEQSILNGKEKCLADIKNELNNRQMDDIHARMSWWACFKEPGKELSHKPIKKTKAKAKKKSKMKQKKASKKANRKKKK